jgi:hypothetical protein
MKKLINLLEEVGSVDTTSYPNIKFEGATASDKINLSLLSDINAAANSSGIRVTLGTAVSGHKETTSSGNESRHTTGEAVDLTRINGVRWSSKSDAESKKILSSIESFVSNLRNAGYTINSESGNPKSVLYFGFPGHDNHIHVSSKVDGSSTDTKIEKPTTDSHEAAKKFATDTLTGMFKPMFNMSESKEKRVILNIEKIKKLL